MKGLHFIMNEFCGHAEDILYKLLKHRMECKTVRVHTFTFNFRKLPIFLFFWEIYLRKLLRKYKVEYKVLKTVFGTVFKLQSTYFNKVSLKQYLNYSLHVLIKLV